MASRGLGFVWIGVVALAVRLFHLWQTHDALISRTLMGDAAVYDAWGRRIAAGDWLGSEVFYQSPLYPYWLAGIYRLTGNGITAVRLVQAVLGAAACVLLAKATECSFSRRAGWVAGFILALFPTAIFFDAIIQKSSLDLFLFSALLLLVARATPATRAPGWIAMGLVLGAFILNRENAILLVVPLALWLVTLHGVRSQRWIGAAGLCALGCLAVLGTVAVRNYHVGGELHLTTSQFGTNFYIGNRPGATGRYDPLRWGQGSAETERTDAIELAEHAVRRKLSPAEVSRYWFGLGWDYIRAQPGSWLRLVGTKLGFLLNATEITDTEDQYTWGDFSWVLAAANPLLHFGVIAPLAAIGVVIAWPRRRKVWILYALLVTYAASVLLFFVNARYRYPLLPLLVPFAAAAVAHPWRATLARRRYGEIATAGALAAGLAVVANRSIVDITTMRAVTLMNLGSYVAEAGDLPSAAKCFTRAVELEPNFAEAQYNLGLALLQMNRADEAVAPFTRAAELAPNEPKARRALQRIQQLKAR